MASWQGQPCALALRLAVLFTFAALARAAILPTLPEGGAFTRVQLVLRVGVCTSAADAPVALLGAVAAAREHGIDRIVLPSFAAPLDHGKADRRASDAPPRLDDIGAVAFGDVFDEAALSAALAYSGVAIVNRAATAALGAAHALGARGDADAWAAFRASRARVVDVACARVASAGADGDAHTSAIAAAAALLRSPSTAAQGPFAATQDVVERHAEALARVLAALVPAPALAAHNAVRLPSPLMARSRSPLSPASVQRKLQTSACSGNMTGITVGVMSDGVAYGCPFPSPHGCIVNVTITGGGGATAAAGFPSSTGQGIGGPGATISGQFILGVPPLCTIQSSAGGMGASGGASGPGGAASALFSDASLLAVAGGGGGGGNAYTLNCASGGDGGAGGPVGGVGGTGGGANWVNGGGTGGTQSSPGAGGVTSQYTGGPGIGGGSFASPGVGGSWCTGLAGATASGGYNAAGGRGCSSNGNYAGGGGGGFFGGGSGGPKQFVCGGGGGGGSSFCNATYQLNCTTMPSGSPQPGVVSVTSVDIITPMAPAPSTNSEAAPCVVSTLAGNASAPSGWADGVGNAALFFSPWGVTLNPRTGDLYVTDTGSAGAGANVWGAVRMVTPWGRVTTLAGGGENQTCLYADGTGTAARFNTPVGITVTDTATAAGTAILVCDATNHVIRKVTLDGVVTTVAGIPQTPSYTNGAALSAQFNFPFGVAVGPTGVVYIADYFNAVIRSISGGVVDLLAGNPLGVGYQDGQGSAALFAGPASLAAYGTVIFVGEYSNRIRRVTAAGFVTTLAFSGATGFADGANAVAMVNGPYGLAADVSGWLYVGDNGNNAVRLVEAAGVSTIVGPSAGGYSDGAVPFANLSQPVGVALDGNGALFVVDASNNAIRSVVCRSRELAFNTRSLESSASPSASPSFSASPSQSGLTSGSFSPLRSSTPSPSVWVTFSAIASRSAAYTPSPSPQATVSGVSEPVILKSLLLRNPPPPSAGSNEAIAARCAANGPNAPPNTGLSAVDCWNPLPLAPVLAELMNAISGSLALQPYSDIALREASPVFESDLLSGAPRTAWGTRFVYTITVASAQSSRIITSYLPDPSADGGSLQPATVDPSFYSGLIVAVNAAFKVDGGVVPHAILEYPNLWSALGYGVATRDSIFFISADSSRPTRVVLPTYYTFTKSPLSSPLSSPTVSASAAASTSAAVATCASLYGDCASCVASDAVVGGCDWTAAGECVSAGSSPSVDIASGGLCPLILCAGLPDGGIVLPSPFPAAGVRLLAGACSLSGALLRNPFLESFVISVMSTSFPAYPGPFLFSDCMTFVVYDDTGVVLLDAAQDTGGGSAPSASGTWLVDAPVQWCWGFQVTLLVSRASSSLASACSAHSVCSSCMGAAAPLGGLQRSYTRGATLGADISADFLLNSTDFCGWGWWGYFGELIRNPTRAPLQLELVQWQPAASFVSEGALLCLSGGMFEPSTCTSGNWTASSPAGWLSPPVVIDTNLRLEAYLREPDSIVATLRVSRGPASCSSSYATCASCIADTAMGGCDYCSTSACAGRGACATGSTVAVSHAPNSMCPHDVCVAAATFTAAGDALTVYASGSSYAWWRSSLCNATIFNPEGVALTIEISPCASACSSFTLAGVWYDASIPHRIVVTSATELSLFADPNYWSPDGSEPPPTPLLLIRAALVRTAGTACPAGLAYATDPVLPPSQVHRRLARSLPPPLEGRPHAALGRALHLSVGGVPYAQPNLTFMGTLSVIRVAFVHVATSCYVNFAELEVLTADGFNVALGGIATSSTTYSGAWGGSANALCNGASGIPSLAIDGDLCTFQATQCEANAAPWWEVDLGPALVGRDLARINLYPRDDAVWANSINGATIIGMDAARNVLFSVPLPMNAVKGWPITWATTAAWPTAVPVCVPCALGHYCPSGATPVPCPAGVYGGSFGLATAECSGPCSAAPGHGCSEGSTSPRGTLCAVGSSCPGGSVPPTTCPIVPVGTTPGASACSQLAPTIDVCASIRYVRLESRAPLNFGELVVALEGGENVALSGSATQSSASAEYQTLCGGARPPSSNAAPFGIDGSLCTFTETAAGAASWWEVDLNRDTSGVSLIELYSRNDDVFGTAFATSINGVDIFLLDSTRRVVAAVTVPSGVALSVFGFNTVCISAAPVGPTSSSVSLSWSTDVGGACLLSPALAPALSLAGVVGSVVTVRGSTVIVAGCGVFDADSGAAVSGAWPALRASPTVALTDSGSVVTSAFAVSPAALSSSSCVADASVNVSWLGFDVSSAPFSTTRAATGGVFSLAPIVSETRDAAELPSAPSAVVVLTAPLRIAVVTPPATLVSLRALAPLPVDFSHSIEFAAGPLQCSFSWDTATLLGATPAVAYVSRVAYVYAPTADGAGLLLCGLSQSIEALSVADGASLWQSPLSALLWASPRTPPTPGTDPSLLEASSARLVTSVTAVPSPSLLFLSLGGASVTALNATSGAPVWAHAVSSRWSFAHPAPPDAALLLARCASIGTLLLSSRDSLRVTALDAASGAVLRSTPLDGTVVARGAYGGVSALLCDAAGWAYALTTGAVFGLSPSGTQSWSIATGAAKSPWAGLAVSNGTLFALGGDDWLYAITAAPQPANASCAAVADTAAAWASARILPADNPANPLGVNAIIAPPSVCLGPGAPAACGSNGEGEGIVWVGGAPAVLLGSLEDLGAQEGPPCTGNSSNATAAYY